MLLTVVSGVDAITTLVRMPARASSRDMNLVRPWRPALAAP
jgi:hypothetical protein